jgi:hypothetical protein
MFLIRDIEAMLHDEGRSANLLRIHRYQWDRRASGVFVDDFYVLLHGHGQAGVILHRLLVADDIRQIKIWYRFGT